MLFCYVYSDRRQAEKTTENKWGWWKTDVGYTHTKTHTHTNTYTYIYIYTQPCDSDITRI